MNEMTDDKRKMKINSQAKRIASPVGLAMTDQ